MREQWVPLFGKWVFLFIERCVTIRVQRNMWSWVNRECVVVGAQGNMLWGVNREYVIINFFFYSGTPT